MARLLCGPHAPPPGSRSNHLDRANELSSPALPLITGADMGTNSFMLAADARRARVCATRPAIACRDDGCGASEPRGPDVSQRRVTC